MPGIGGSADEITNGWVVHVVGRLDSEDMGADRMDASDGKLAELETGVRGSDRAGPVIVAEDPVAVDSKGTPAIDPGGGRECPGRIAAPDGSPARGRSRGKAQFVR